MTALASAFVDVRLDLSGVPRQLNTGVTRAADRAGRDGAKSLTGHFGKAAKVIGATLAGAFAITQGVSFLKDSIGEAREAQKVGAQTAAVLKSTGGAANISRKQIEALATSISNKTGIDDEAIQSGANLLLTFKNVRNEVGKGNDIFNQSVGVVTDMSAALGQSAKTSSIQLGKALNDPIKGITALSRVGVTFDAGQKKQIKTLVKHGDTLAAQKIILRELNSEFQGSAEAQATPAEKAKVAWDNFKEELGTAVLPVVDKLATFLTTKVIPALEGMGSAFQTYILPTLKRVGGAIGQFAEGLKYTWDVITSGDDVAAGVGETLDYALGNTGKFVKPIQAVTAAISNFFQEMKTGTGDGGRFADVLRTMGTVATNLGGFLRDNVLPALVGLGGFLVRNKAVVATFAGVILAVAAGIRIWAAAQALLNVVLSANPLGIVVVAIAAFAAGLVYAYRKSDTFKKIVDGAFKGVAAAVSWAWNKVIKPLLKAWWWYISNVLIPIIKWLWTHVVKPVFRALGNYIADTWKQTIKPAFDKLKSGVGAVRDAFSAAVRIIKRVWGGIQGALAGPVNWVIKNVVNKLIGAINFVWTHLGHDKNLLGTLGGVQLPTGGGRGGGMASGGVLPGWTPGRDVHDFYSPTGGRLSLSGGEAIMRPEWTKAVGGPRAVARMNAEARLGRLAEGSQAYADGGLVTFKGGRFTRTFANTLSRVHQAFRVIQGGFRPTTSYSGTSHNMDAVDVGPVSAALVRAMRAVGIAAWDRTGMGNWGPHIHGVPLPGRGFGSPSARAQAQSYLHGGNGLGGRDNGLGSEGPNLLGAAGRAFLNSFPGGSLLGYGFDAVKYMANKVRDITQAAKGAPGGVIGDIAGSVIGKLGGAAKGWAGGLAAKVGSFIDGKLGFGSGSPQRIAQAMLGNYGWTSREFPSLNQLWTKESGWRVHALNKSSGAYGIPQSLPASKMASAGADWRDNPATQIRWGLGYIKSRYGSPHAAWAHSVAHNWYDAGGLATGRGYMAKNTLRPERVLTPRQTDTYDKLLPILERLERSGSGPLVHMENVYTRDEKALAYATRREQQKALVLARSYA